MKKKPEQIIRERGGHIRMSEALELGMSRSMFYSLRDKGVIGPIARGVYRLGELGPVTNPDLVTVSLRIPKGVICLVSALAFHEMTTQIPHEVSVALPRRSRIPKLDYPPVRVYMFSEAAYASGIEQHRIDGVATRIYNPEKTLADCFKFRNDIGMDVVLEALKLYRERKKFDVQKLVEYGKICRVERVMRPYLEAIL